MRSYPQVVARLENYRPGDCLISTVAVYELYVGVAKCREPDRERDKVRRLLSWLRVEVFDEAAARCAAQVRVDLEKEGRVCGPYDLLLAGHALALNSTLATNNVKEFVRVQGLVVEDWMA